MKKITVMIVEDHLIVREGLSLLLKHELDIEVIAEAENGRQSIQLALKHLPNVVVMDIGMPLLNGMEAARQILKHRPEIKILILSAHSDSAYVEQVTALGAVGFLLKHTSSHELANAIREVAKGNTYFSTLIDERLHHLTRKLGYTEAESAKRNKLSSRELEVLQLIAEGMANKMVAAELVVTFKTVDKHRQHLMAKLNIHDIASLTRYAIAEGIIESSVRVTII